MLEVRMVPCRGAANLHPNRTLDGSGGRPGSHQCRSHRRAHAENSGLRTRKVFSHATYADRIVATHWVPTTSARVLCDPGEFDHRRGPVLRCRHWPSPRSERLGTPKVPAIRFARGTYFGASWFALRCGLPSCSPPCDGSNRVTPAPEGFYFQAFGRSVTLAAAAWTGLLVLAGLSPAGIAASLAAPDPGVRC